MHGYQFINNKVNINYKREQNSFQPMLTAVENHFGPGRPYSTLHYGAVTNLLPPCPMTPLPTLNSATPMAMSPAEFARPHPKTASRMNGIQSLRACNGISSPRSKYSSIDQSGPVNLAMAAHHPISSPDARRKSPQSAFNDPVTSNSEPSHSDQDAIHRSIASLYGTPFCPTPVSAGVNSQSVAAYQMNFSNMYGRAGVYPYVFNSTDNAEGSETDMSEQVI